MKEEAKPNTCPECGGKLPGNDPNQPCRKCALKVAMLQSRATLDTTQIMPGDSSNPKPEPDDRDGRPRYQIGNLLARGGMGRVLDAREVPVGRRVAMKVIHDEFNRHPSVRQRFVEEAQITGQLEHPSIVPMHDRGIDGEGNEFYTMKLVEGLTLAQILNRLATQIRDGRSNNKPDFIARFPLIRLLTIFQKICDAVAFAHSRGVIHRDLKPANVMVGEFGEVLVMDWGLAKVIDLPDLDITIQEKAHHDDDDDVVRTQSGQTLGTVGYMPPEQASGEIERLGFEADIYALGAILYEILTLQRTIRARHVNQALKQIRAGEIEDPITLTRSKTGQSLPPRHCPDHRVPKSLAAVAMKALATEPEDRYESVEALQAEIEAYQNGFATEAEHASFWKHLRLFVRRHKTESIAAGLIVALLVVGMAVSDHFRRQAQAERAIAVAARNEAQATASFLTSLIERPVSGDARKLAALRYVELLDQAHQRLKEEEDLPESTQFELLRTIANSYVRSGRKVQAAQLREDIVLLAERIHGPASAEAFQRRHSLAVAYQVVGMHEDSVAVAEELDVDLAAAGRVEDDPLVRKNRVVWAQSLGFSPDPQDKDRALELIREQWEIEARLHGEESESAMAMVDYRARILSERGFTTKNLEQALKLAEQAHAWRRENLGPNNHGTRGSEQLIRTLKSWLGVAEASPEEVEQQLETLRADWKDDHPQIIQTMKSLAEAYWSRGDRARHDALVEEAYQIARDKLEVTNVHRKDITIKYCGVLMRVNRDEGREAAIRIWESYLAELDQADFAPPRMRFFVLDELGTVHHGRKDWESALAVQQALLAHAESRYPRGLSRALLVLGQTYRGMGQLDEAEAVLRRNLDLLANRPAHGSTQIRFQLGNVLAIKAVREEGEARKAELRAEADRCHETAFRLHDEAYGSRFDSQITGILAACGQVYMRQERYEEALKLRQRTLAVHEQLHGENYWETVATKNGIAHAQLALGQEEAGWKMMEEFLAGWRQLEGWQARMPAIRFGVEGAWREYDEAGKRQEADAVAVELFQWLWEHEKNRANNQLVRFAARALPLMDIDDAEQKRMAGEIIAAIRAVENPTSEHRKWLPELEELTRQGAFQKKNRAGL